MATNERNLWPQDLFTAVDIQRTPLALLREQATLLGENTNNLVEAKVVTNTEGASFVQYFNLVSPILKNYTYQLFHLVHPIDGYPLRVIFKDSEYVIKSEEELIANLRSIFADEKTRRVVQAMIAQSQS